MKNTIEDFLIYVKESKKMSENTILAYRRDLNAMIAYFEKQGIESVEKITTTNINSYVLFLEKMENLQLRYLQIRLRILLRQQMAMNQRI